MSEQNEVRTQIGFDVAELSVIRLKPGDVLSVKLTGDDLSIDNMDSLRDHLKKVFPDNKVLVFQMPNGSDIQFEAIRQENTSYCNDCNCGKKESAEK